MYDNESLRDCRGDSPLAGRVAVVTGGAQGIGRALVHELAREPVRAVVVFDRDISDVTSLCEAKLPSGTHIVAYEGDVRKPDDIARLVRNTEEKFGCIDIFCSNAGVMTDGGVDVPDSAWQQSWEVNVMAHVHAARSALPGMLSRGGGVFLNILSAAGLLTAPGAAPYAVTKHAALGFSEWLAIKYKHNGIRVCAVCPEAVDTQMLHLSLADGNTGVKKIADSGEVLSPGDVASAAIRALESGDFLVATHPRTLRNVQRKWADVDKWIGAMSSFLEERFD
jgi:NAD(P)-dependent dehydrogenase (short-subunit alcohol dehydrogenase family)